MNLFTFAVASRAAWKRVKPALVKDTFLLPLLGFAELIAMWWAIALLGLELISIPLQALDN